MSRRKSFPHVLYVRIDDELRQKLEERLAQENSHQHGRCLSMADLVRSILWKDLTPTPEHEGQNTEASHSRCKARGHKLTSHEVHPFKPRHGCAVCDVWFSDPELGGK